MDENKNIINEEEAAKVSGGVTREEYVAQFRKFGLIDGATPQHNGETCDVCSRGKLNFLKYQTGRCGISGRRKLINKTVYKIPEA